MHTLHEAVEKKHYNTLESSYPQEDSCSIHLDSSGVAAALNLFMKNPTASRFWAFAILAGTVSLGPVASRMPAQAPQAATQSLLDKAHALEVRGRMDMAAQTWQQVLLADPNNTEALGGLARAAKLTGNQPLAATYLDRLRAINPNDPTIARIETMETQADHNAQLQQAGKLAQQGQYAQSMQIYRQIFGDTPPAGDLALAYYETEAATEEGRPHAIAGLRNLVAKNPGDSRYQVTLGRILTYNPKTREEGRKLLEAHPSDPQAVEALRQSLLWDAQNPASGNDIRAYLQHHPDAQLSQALKVLPKTGGGARQAPAMTTEQKAAAAVNATRSAADTAAYRALNAKHLEEAEQKFKAILADSPDDANALAGMGYIRMQQANFGGSISFLVQAKQDGSKDPGLDAALATSRFWYTMGEGAIALNENDLPTAEKQYRAALAMRPTSVEALEGLGGTLLKAQQPEAAVPYFAQFTKLKPAAAHAWRGLFLAQYGAGDAPHALLTEKAMPAPVRAELSRDPLYLRTLSSAYSAVGRDADAQRVLRAALDLPFPADARGLEAGTQLQFAGLLQAANHTEQAAGLYRQVLAKDQNNTDAWQGLVRAEHALGQDQQALQTLESMPPASYAKVMRDPGFEATVGLALSVEQAAGCRAGHSRKSDRAADLDRTEAVGAGRTAACGDLSRTQRSAAGLPHLSPGAERKSRSYRRVEGSAFGAAQHRPRLRGAGRGAADSAGYAGAARERCRLPADSGRGLQRSRPDAAVAAFPAPRAAALCDGTRDGAGRY